MRPENMTTDALAFLGDAVYETAIRERLLRKGIARADRLHRETVRYVSADAQARIIRNLFPRLTETEQTRLKRWRNHKYHSKAKNADPMTYKWATAFEALVGYLYLAGDSQRLDWLLQEAAVIIEDNDTGEN
jgi:ribonuclease-3 family protein